MAEPAEGAWVAAFMRAADVQEFHIPDEWIENPEAGSVMRYRDEAAGTTVFRFVPQHNILLDSKEAEALGRGR